MFELLSKNPDGSVIVVDLIQCVNNRSRAAQLINAPNGTQSDAKCSNKNESHWEKDRKADSTGDKEECLSMCVLYVRLCEKD